MTADHLNAGDDDDDDDDDEVAEEEPRGQDDDEVEDDDDDDDDNDDNRDGMGERQVAGEHSNDEMQGGDVRQEDGDDDDDDDDDDVAKDEDEEMGDADEGRSLVADDESRLKEGPANADSDDDEEEGGINTIGGTIDRPAFALLAGHCEDPKDGKISKVAVPIHKLPVTLGRSHKTDDPTFIPLGMGRALSRNHCTIYYRDLAGGRLGQYKGDDEDEDGDDNDDADGPKLVYRPPEVFEDDDEQKREGGDGTKDAGSKVIIRPGRSRAFPYDDHSDDEDEDEETGDGRLPSKGFFAVECVGKNKVVVGGEKVEQGQVALLESGTAIRISSFNLYFLLPKRPPGSKPTTVRVPNPNYDPKAVKRARDTSDAASGEDRKKQKMASPEAAPSSASPPGAVRAASTASAATSNSTTSNSNARANSMLNAPLRRAFGGGSDLEYLPLEVLMNKMTYATKSHIWDRRHQLIGSAISLHAVRDAARDPHIRRLAMKEGGVARADVINWIEKSPKYKEWVGQMLQKLEFKSWQSNVSKALMRAGYLRTGTTGRHVRWSLPTDIEEEAPGNENQETGGTSPAGSGGGDNDEEDDDEGDRESDDHDQDGEDGAEAGEHDNDEGEGEEEQEGEGDDEDDNHAPRNDDEDDDEDGDDDDEE